MGNFIAAVVFYQLVPLVPLWFEFYHTQDIKQDSYILCAAMYSFAIGFSSKHLGQLSVCFLLGLLLAGCYKGNTNVSALPLTHSLITLALALVFVVHLFERFKRHITNGELFFNFKK